MTFGARYYISQSQRFGGLWGGLGISGRVASHWLEGSPVSAQAGHTANDGDLVVVGVHALQI